jgi:hypothetical protein
LEIQLPGGGRQDTWTLNIPVNLDADVHRLKAQSHDSSDTAAEWHQPDVTARRSLELSKVTILQFISTAVMESRRTPVDV